MSSLLPTPPLQPLLTSLLSLLLAFGISLALTFTTSPTPKGSDISVPNLSSPTPLTANLCGASLCSARWFPTATRLHVLHYYVWLTVTSFGLYYRDLFKSVLSLSVTFPHIPLLLPKKKNNFVSVGNLLMFVWILFFFANGLAIWASDMRSAYASRAGRTDAREGTIRLSIAGCTGHIADLTLGLCLLTVARTTLLNSTFNIPRSSLLTFHIFCAYTLLIIVVIHFSAFYSWVPIFVTMSSPAKEIFSFDNPTFTEGEINANYYRALCFTSGMLAFGSVLYITIASLPYFRVKKYDFFYLSHTVTLLIIIFACLHADTNFYCILPGLLAWISDWIWRAKGLYKQREAILTALGKGWYRIDIPVTPTAVFVNANSSSNSNTDASASTAEREVGIISYDENEDSSVDVDEMFRMPALNAYYICVPQVSKWSLHPFTTITDMVTLAKKLRNGESGVVSFVFRPVLIDRDSVTVVVGGSDIGDVSTVEKEEKVARKKKMKEEWTVAVSKLLVSADASKATVSSFSSSLHQNEDAIPFSERLLSERLPPSLSLPVRIEGPYSTYLHPHPFSFAHLLLIMGGADITGAIAIARQVKSLLALRTRPVWLATERVTLVWTLRRCDYISLAEMGCEDVEGGAVEIFLHLTGDGKKRLDTAAAIQRVIQVEETMRQTTRKLSKKPLVWIYASGPRGLLERIDEASRAANCPKRKVECYCAHWDR